MNPLLFNHLASNQALLKDQYKQQEHNKILLRRAIRLQYNLNWDCDKVKDLLVHKFNIDESIIKQTNNGTLYLSPYPY